MRRSSEWILASHAGALPRPEGLQRLFDGGPAEEEAFTAALPGAVAEVVAQQAAAGLDVVNDGEISKRGLFTGYIRDRMSGFEQRQGQPGACQPANAGRDRARPPGLPRVLRGGAGRVRRGAAAAWQQDASSASDLLLHRPAALHRPGGRGRPTSPG